MQSQQLNWVQLKFSDSFCISCQSFYGEFQCRREKADNSVFADEIPLRNKYFLLSNLINFKQKRARAPDGGLKVMNLWIIRLHGFLCTWSLNCRTFSLLWIPRTIVTFSLSCIIKFCESYKRETRENLCRKTFWAKVEWKSLKWILEYENKAASFIKLFSFRNVFCSYNENLICMLNLVSNLYHSARSNTKWEKERKASEIENNVGWKWSVA